MNQKVLCTDYIELYNDKIISGREYVVLLENQYH